MNHDSELEKFAALVKSVATSLASQCDDILPGQKDSANTAITGEAFGNGAPSLPLLARTLYKARRAREDIAPEKDLFQDPAWDILLDLYIAHSEDKFISVTSASLAAGVPLTTALRWVWHLEQLHLITRQVDPNDRRRSFVTLTDTGLVMVERALNDFNDRIGPMFVHQAMA